VQEQSLPVLVDDTRHYQRLIGFGASLTGASAELIGTLSDADRDRLMTRLFSPEAGIGLSVLRQPLGPNDFSSDNRSYNDLPAGRTDPGLRGFSLGREASVVLPLLRQARRLNGPLYVVASPWTAPTWMKTSRSLGHGTLRRRAYDPYARYLVRALQEYAAAGVPVNGLTLQNEPSFAPRRYPGMTLAVEQQRILLNAHLAPALAAAGLHPDVYALDDSFDRSADALALLADPATRSHLAGVAFHCYRGDVSALRSIRDRYPDVVLAISECTGGQWDADFGRALRWDVHTLLVQGLRNGAAWVVKWNLALDPSGGPRNGGCSNCRGMVTIDPSRGSVDVNEEFYALGHVSRFVRPGATVVASTTYGGDSVETVAFRNPDGGHVLLALNSSRDQKEIDVAGSGSWFGYRLPPGAVATFTW
jgi:glucosylceramidase